MFLQVKDFIGEIQQNIAFSLTFYKDVLKGLFWPYKINM